MVAVIAEIGVNHDGSEIQAHELIDAAARAGADFVKFQTFNADKLEPPGPRRDMLKGLELPWECYPDLRFHAIEVGVEFISTPFDVQSLEFLVDLGMGFIKISSGSLENTPLLKAVAETKLPVFLSTGMTDLNKIHDVLNIVESPILLHCTSSYPCPPEDVNLLAIQTLADVFIRPVGFSDHTQSLILPAAAVAMGAAVIEKHFTCDNDLSGPDHHMSLEPDQFKIMVDNIREVEASAGDGVKRPMPSEELVIDVVSEWRKL